MSEGNKEVVKEYKKDDLTVVWKPNTCIHSKKCWKELLQVFDPRNRPWINLEGATKERIKKQVDACPSGALSYLSNSKEQKEESNLIKAQCFKNGPLMISGDINLINSDGTEETRKKATAFCRCGASENKPFCDGSHKQINFIG